LRASPHAAKINLFDGMTGDNSIAGNVGYILPLLKLCIVVDDKIHARSADRTHLSPSSLGGKAQFGGQRFRRNGSVGL